ncbi:unnamed protein product [Vitrella brassicaformis CCMP3155]|uniref:Uncharacterized protein n=2 Tax=Vitrella brassicaformis TaxID=1169539 RepID=A0A0G4EA84_VITBC|nr:unnamed protein product [Vitrella brassicaformis CCMP3155]|eukprot:CEL92379.1 unnamed protein product [Vitrella brassicaformis CCMP3155]
MSFDDVEDELRQRRHDPSHAREGEDLDVFDPDVWREARSVAVTRTRQLLQEDGDSHTCVIVDDNFYRRSMRKAFAKLARECASGFVQLLLDLPAEAAVARNENRSSCPSPSVPSFVIRHMAECVEWPPSSTDLSASGQHDHKSTATAANGVHYRIRWESAVERSTAHIDSTTPPDDMVSSIVRWLSESVEPWRPIVAVDSEGRESGEGTTDGGRGKVTSSPIQEIEVRLRRLISEALKTCSGGDRGVTGELAQRWSRLKSEFMREVKAQVAARNGEGVCDDEALDGLYDAFMRRCQQDAADYLSTGACSS